MKNTSELKNIPDDELLPRLSELLKQSRRVEAVLVAHIGEVDERKLFAREASSMFTYCTDILHLAENEAYNRIAAARASRKYPKLLAMLSDGRLHLSGIVRLGPHLTDSNCDEVLARATHKTKREIVQLVAELAPKPDVPSSVRKLPARPESVPAVQLVPERVTDLPTSTPARPSPPAESRLAPPPMPPPPARSSPPAPPVAAVQPLSPARYKVQFTASAELRDKLERLQALTHEDLANAIEAAVTERLERVEAKRFGLTKKARKSLEETDTEPTSRYIPAPVKRIVRRRDDNQCTHIDRNGRRCTERRGLEFHHRNPYGRGGDHSPENICLMCRGHNAYLAELEYGKEWMGKFRRSDRVSEPAPAFLLGLPVTAIATYGTARSRDA